MENENVILVIGAGLAGTLTALELAKNYPVIVIDPGAEVISESCTSGNQCFKIHTGMHYLGDIETAELCLRKAIIFARKFPEFIAGGQDLLSPWRRGRHYVMANSMISTDRVEEVRLHLQELYASLCEEDPANQVFGDPEQFITTLQPEHYSYIADSIPFYDENGAESQTAVVKAFETAESQVDIRALKAHLQTQIAENANITFIPLTHVTRISYCEDQFGFRVSAVNAEGLPQEFPPVAAVVNCAWQNIELLDNTIEPVSDPNRVIRGKVSIVVNLPESLRSMNTCIFSTGPYCSMTVFPNGQAILTSERVTNFDHYPAGIEMPDRIKDFIASTTPNSEIATQILHDCASYLKEPYQSDLLRAPIKQVRVGFVKQMYLEKQYTRREIFNKENSVIHERRQDGIERRGFSRWSHSGEKMTYIPDNADKVASLVSNEVALIPKLEALVLLIKEYLPDDIKQHYESTINSILYVNWRERLPALLLEEQNDQSLREHAQVLAGELIRKLSIPIAVRPAHPLRFLNGNQRLVNRYAELLFKINQDHSAEDSLPVNQRNLSTSLKPIQKLHFNGKTFARGIVKMPKGMPSLEMMFFKPLTQLLRQAEEHREQLKK